MVDTPRSQAYLLGSEFQDGQTPQSITAQRIRDLVVTVVPTGIVVTSGSSVTMTTTKLVINKSSGSPTAVTLPSSPTAWTTEYVVKDGKGDAFTNPITVTSASGLIDNASSFIIATNGGSGSFIFDGTNWNIV